jgi:hypothetical protein
VGDASSLLIVVGSILFLVGAWCLVSLVRTIASQRRERAGRASAPGEVVALKGPDTLRAHLEVDGLVIGASDFAMMEARLTYPVVRFTDGQGQARTFLSQVGFNPPQHRVGERVTVRYDPRDATTAEVDSTFVRWLHPVLLGAFGATFTLVGLGLAVAGIAIRMLR